MRTRLLVPCLCIALAACGGAPQGADTAANETVESAGISTAQQLDAIYAQYWEAALERNPLRATFIGDARYNDRMHNTLSPAYRDASKIGRASRRERVCQHVG